MKLDPDPEMLAWLARGGWAIEWDAGNLTKNEKHSVSTDDVEALLGGRFGFAGRVVRRPDQESRWLILGESAGRKLALVFTRRGDSLRPICCRPMRKKEKVIYEKEKHTLRG